jgi:hypothetical protein
VVFFRGAGLFSGLWGKNAFLGCCKEKKKKNGGKKKGFSQGKKKKKKVNTLSIPTHRRIIKKYLTLKNKTETEKRKGLDKRKFIRYAKFNLLFLPFVLQRGKRVTERMLVFFIKKQEAVAVSVPVIQKGNTSKALKPLFVLRGEK